MQGGKGGCKEGREQEEEVRREAEDEGVRDCEILFSITITCSISLYLIYLPSSYAYLTVLLPSHV